MALGEQRKKKNTAQPLNLPGPVNSRRTRVYLNYSTECFWTDIHGACFLIQTYAKQLPDYSQHKRQETKIPESDGKKFKLFSWHDKEISYTYMYQIRSKTLLIAFTFQSLDNIATHKYGLNGYHNSVRTDVWLELQLPPAKIKKKVRVNFFKKGIIPSCFHSLCVFFSRLIFSQFLFQAYFLSLIWVFTFLESLFEMTLKLKLLVRQNNARFF